LAEFAFDRVYDEDDEALLKSSGCSTTTIASLSSLTPISSGLAIKQKKISAETAK
jgi:hypothetical protein